MTRDSKACKATLSVAQKAATPCKWHFDEKGVRSLLAGYLDACISRPRGGRGAKEKKVESLRSEVVVVVVSTRWVSIRGQPASDFSNHRENHRGWCCLSGTSHCDSKRALLLYRMWLAERRAGSQWPSPVPVSPGHDPTRYR